MLPNKPLRLLHMLWIYVILITTPWTVQDDALMVRSAWKKIDALQEMWEDLEYVYAFVEIVYGWEKPTGHVVPKKRTPCTLGSA